jgi:Asp-tRNA(Asn)/Glu-tRNA(Gln) amidotransferase A subunit family amidase
LIPIGFSDGLSLATDPTRTLCPVAAIPAFHHGERGWRVDGKTVDYLDAWSYTVWFNLLGTPAAAVPVSQSPERLPIGVQIWALPWQEEVVLAIAEIVEKECGGWKPPPIDAGCGSIEDLA